MITSHTQKTPVQGGSEPRQKSCFGQRGREMSTFRWCFDLTLLGKRILANNTVISYFWKYVTLKSSKILV